MTLKLAEFLEPDNTYRTAGYNCKFEKIFLMLFKPERQEIVNKLCAKWIAKTTEQMVKRWNHKHPPITFAPEKEVKV